MNSQTDSVGRVGVDGEQVGNATDKGVIRRCLLVCVVVVLILAQGGVDDVPLIRGEELADGQEVGACCHVGVFLNYSKSTPWCAANATNPVPVRKPVSAP